MVRWEYTGARVAVHDMDVELAKFGDQGWELVHCEFFPGEHCRVAGPTEDEYALIFKRPILADGTNLEEQEA